MTLGVSNDWTVPAGITTTCVSSPVRTFDPSLLALVQVTIERAMVAAALGRGIIRSRGFERQPRRSASGIRSARDCEHRAIATRELAWPAGAVGARLIVCRAIGGIGRLLQPLFGRGAHQWPSRVSSPTVHVSSER